MLIHELILLRLAIIGTLAQQNNVSPVAANADTFIKTINSFLRVVRSGTEINYIFPFPNFIIFTPFDVAWLDAEKAFTG